MSDAMNRVAADLNNFSLKFKCEETWRKPGIAYPMHIAGWKESGGILTKIKCRMLSPINRFSAYLNRVRRYMVHGR